jgi:hypothetical protein
MSIAQGTAIILAGQVTVTVPHGLTSTPTLAQILLTPQDNLGGRDYWPSNITSSTFTINISFLDPDVDHSFGWQILKAGIISAPLGPGLYIESLDVATALNATFDGVHTYTVYGLTILDATMQAHTDYANTYINGMLGRILATTDLLYPTAKLAALNVACLRVLVISSGGSLVGAFDYFLGDMRVIRHGPYAAALLRTIQGLKEDLVKMMTNLSTPVKTADASLGSQVPTYRGGLASP